MRDLVVDDFSGGLNLRDTPNKLALNESPACFNFALTERGGLKRRNSHANLVALPGVSGKFTYIFFSAAVNQWCCVRETAGAPNNLRLHTRPADLSGSWTDRGQVGATGGAMPGFVDFPGATPKLVISTNVKSALGAGGIFTWDGTTLTNVGAGDLVCGDAVALWQNKVWVAGYPISDADGDPTLVRWSDAGDPTAWTATNTQKIRDLNANPVTALGVVGGNLVAFKKRSTHVITDPSNGSYRTIDPAHGCVNARALVALHGRLYVWGADGIYECDGSGPLRNVGDKLRPIYQHASTDPTTIIAGVFEDHAIFAGTLGGTQFSGNTGQIVDYSPMQKSAVLHTLSNSGQDLPTSFASKDGVLYSAISDGDDLFRMFTETPGVTDGTNETASWELPWLLPNAGALARLQRLRVQGLLGANNISQSVTMYKNWDTSSGDVLDLVGLFTSGPVQTAVDFNALGHAYSFGPTISIGGGAATLSIRAVELLTQELRYPSVGYPRSSPSATPPPVPSPPPQ